MKCFLIGYTANDGASEFSSIHGRKVKDNDVLAPLSEIRSECLKWANRDGGNFNYLQINFITQLDESDYDSFMEVN